MERGDDNRTPEYFSNTFPMYSKSTFAVQNSTFGVQNLSNKFFGEPFFGKGLRVKWQESPREVARASPRRFSEFFRVRNRPKTSEKHLKPSKK